MLGQLSFHLRRETWRKQNQCTHICPKLFRSWPRAFHHCSCACSLVLACHVINKGKCQSLPERLKIPGPKWRQLRPLNTDTSMRQTTTHCAELQMKYFDYINLHCVKNGVTTWLLSYTEFTLHCTLSFSLQHQFTQLKPFPTNRLKQILKYYRADFNSESEPLLNYSKKLAMKCSTAHSIINLFIIYFGVRGLPRKLKIFKK